jgi:hypothetical protein
MQLLPFCLVPAVLVPFYLITHSIIFAQLVPQRALQVVCPQDDVTRRRRTTGLAPLRLWIREFESSRPSQPVAFLRPTSVRPRLR